MVCCFMWLSKCPKGHLQGVSCSKSDGNMAKWLRLPKIIVHLLGLQHRKTGKTPCAGCKMSLASHGRCIRLKIPRASSGIFRRLHHPPCRVLHPAQGDKQKKQTLSSVKIQLYSMTITLVLGNNAAVLHDSDPFLCNKKSLSSVTVMLYKNSVLEVDTVTMYLYQ